MTARTQKDAYGRPLTTTVFGSIARKSVTRIGAAAQGSAS